MAQCGHCGFYRFRLHSNNMRWSNIGSGVHSPRLTLRKSCRATDPSLRRYDIIPRRGSRTSPLTRLGSMLSVLSFFMATMMLPCFLSRLLWRRKHLSALYQCKGGECRPTIPCRSPFLRGHSIRHFTLWMN